MKKQDLMTPEERLAEEKKELLRRLLGLTRKAVQDYGLIREHDKICVGLSGGKDSMALLTVLAALRRFYPKPFELCAVSVSTGEKGMDFSPVAAYCAELGVEYRLVETQIREIVFDLRHEKNPCALCANLRRGALNDHARQMGCNLVALGHHRDDVIETAFLSLSYEGRFYCFSPKTYLERSGITVIRPFLYVEESLIRRFRKAADFPVLVNPCPMDKTSKRAESKKLLWELDARNHDFRQNLFGAVKRGLWAAETDRPEKGGL